MKRSITSFCHNRLIRDGLPIWRSQCVSALLTSGFLALAARAFWIQGIHPDFYIREGQKRFEHVFEVKPVRGRITDRNGGPLAIGRPAADIWIVPAEFRSASNSNVTRLASLLGLQESVIASRGNGNRKFIALKRGVAPEVASNVARLNVPGVYLIQDDRRYYPGGSDFAQLVGWVGVDGRGLEGVELADDALLSGSASKRRLIEDRMGNPVDIVGVDTVGVASSDLTLSIDRRIQHMARLAVEHTVERFAAVAGSAIVVDAKTGEILALVNLPTFDPNEPVSAYDTRCRNRVIADAFEPGSTIKPITVALALTKGIITPETRFDTSPGSLKVYGSVIHDTSNFGSLSVTQIITKSSNIGMAKIAMMLSSQDMWGMFHRFGLGSLPLKALPAVAKGALHPVRHWMPIEKLTMAYGYGLSLSLAQLADVYTVFANDGRRIPLSLTRLSTPPVGEPVISSRVAQQIRTILEADGREGTARVAGLPDYRTGGKTGTARKQSGHGYARGKYRAVFVGMAPMSNPRLIVAVMIDEPSRGSYYGARVAGPVCGEIMESALHLLGVLPDRRSS
ncbi:penicillin-binding protein 2 [Burkholderia stabilis]|uniref:Penicillin-binding protein 2 n=1 Tax=Burkholderia stabilis TaxID=95485 RepID=A0A4V1PQT7_9BURK|nr:penicillin-binding protein 2 [Burkholderia stabilis]RXV65234.1 penicillin-binding protein 2 [Burkholderia stabilis]